MTIKKSIRVKQVEGIFDLTIPEKSRTEWDCHLILDKPWNVGLIVGRSGSGKTTIARELFGDVLETEYRWSRQKSLLDDFSASMATNEVTDLLCSVGFSSPPSWLRPFHCLSNGEQFRVCMARLLAEDQEVSVVDEFTSVVDRDVAKATSNAIQKAVRRKERKFVAISCHYDIVEWLDPDWVYEPEKDKLHWRCERRSRPEIRLEIKRVHRSHWRIFSKHHYLTRNHNRSSHCYLAEYNGVPIAWVSVMSYPHPITPCWMIHRIVVLPDYQGLSIGMRILDVIGSIYCSTGKSLRIMSSHPSIVNGLGRSVKWKLQRKGFVSSHKTVAGCNDYQKKYRKTTAETRVTASYKYCGKKDKQMALAMGIKRKEASRVDMARLKAKCRRKKRSKK